MGVIQIIGVLLALASIFMPKTYQFLSVYLSFYTLCITILYKKTVITSNHLNRRKIEGGFFKKKKFPPALTRILYSFNSTDSIYTVVAYIQIALFVYSFICGTFFLVMVADTFLAQIQINNRIYIGALILLFVIILIIAVFECVIRYIAKWDQMFPIKKEDFSATKQIIKRERKNKKIVERLEWHVSVEQELNRFRTYKEKGIYYICQSDTERIEKILSNKYPGASWEYSENGKSKVELIIRDKETNEIIYQAPIKKK